ncbi:protein of unknown function [Methylocaldum szegediense]|uniref:Uncharacterized protein n=1 Tax=Methylocaldum szegediense TaxID=73780 RepID=A0ABM9I251_9GAMM|nr:protein of unknown function [Methylocaldum szegediense]
MICFRKEAAKMARVTKLPVCPRGHTGVR